MQIERNLATLIWMRLARIGRKHERAAAEHLQAWHLTVAQFDVLARLLLADTVLSQRMLAERLLVTQGNITQLLDRLELGGYVMRQRSDRKNHICLTEAGKQLSEEIVVAHEGWHKKYFAALSLAEQAQLLHLLSKLEHSL